MGRGVVALGIGRRGCSGFASIRSSLLRGRLGHFSRDPVIDGRSITVSRSANVAAYGSRGIRIKQSMREWMDKLAADWGGGGGQRGGLQRPRRSGEVHSSPTLPGCLTRRVRELREIRDAWSTWTGSPGLLMRCLAGEDGNELERILRERPKSVSPRARRGTALGGRKGMERAFLYGWNCTSMAV